MFGYYLGEIKKFRKYLFGTVVLLETDHKHL